MRWRTCYRKASKVMNIKRNKMEWTGIGERLQKSSGCAWNIVKLGEKGESPGRQFPELIKRTGTGWVLTAGRRTAM